MSFSSFFHNIEADFGKAEHFLLMEVGDVKKYFVAHPNLAADMKLLFGPAIAILVNEAKAIESQALSAVGSGATVGSLLNSVVNGIGNAIPKAVTSIVDQADNSANAFQIGASAAQFLVGQILAKTTPEQLAAPVTGSTVIAEPAAAGA